MKKLLIAIFIVSLTVIGCEIPYTGPMLTVDDVDRYLYSTLVRTLSACKTDLTLFA